MYIPIYADTHISCQEKAMDMKTGTDTDTDIAIPIHLHFLQTTAAKMCGSCVTPERSILLVQLLEPKPSVFTISPDRQKLPLVPRVELGINSLTGSRFTLSL